MLSKDETQNKLYHKSSIININLQELDMKSDIFLLSNCGKVGAIRRVN